MKTLLRIALLLPLASAACNLRLPSKAPAPSPPAKGPEATGQPAIAFERGSRPNAYWLTNPTSGAALHVEVIHPPDWDGSTPLPAIVLVPGGSGDSRAFRGSAARQPLALLQAGFAVVIFDPDGRGFSGGEEDYNGFIHQDGLAQVIRFAAALPQVDGDRVGLATISYGITMATGALARHPDLPARFLIDAEGPADRNDTGGCDAAGTGHLGEVAACDDEDFWAQREALTLIAQVAVPYQRLQTATDHVQPDNTHAILMNNAAVNGRSPWVRLNDLQPNQLYDPASPPPLLPDSYDGRWMELFSRYALEMLALP